MILIWTRRIQSFRFKVRPITCASLLHQFEPFGWAGVVTLQGHCWGSPYLDISFGIVHDFLINRIIVRNKLNASWTHINPSGGFLFSSANRVTSIQGRISPVLHGITNSLFTFLIVHLFWLESFHVNFRCEIFHIHYQKITRPTSPRVQGESMNISRRTFVPNWCTRPWPLDKYGIECHFCSKRNNRPIKWWIEPTLTRCLAPSASRSCTFRR